MEEEMVLVPKPLLLALGDYLQGLPHRDVNPFLVALEGCQIVKPEPERLSCNTVHPEADVYHPGGHPRSDPEPYPAP